MTVLPAVATMFRRLLDAGFSGARRLRLGLSGAAPRPWYLAPTWPQRPGVTVVGGHGKRPLMVGYAPVVGTLTARGVVTSSPATASGADESGRVSSSTAAEPAVPPADS